MRGCFCLWHQEPKGLQRTQSGSGDYIGAPGVVSFVQAFVHRRASRCERGRRNQTRAARMERHSSKVRREGQSRTVSTRLAEAVANVVYTGLDLSHITKRHGVETEIDPND